MGELEKILNSPHKLEIFLAVIAAFIALQFLVKLYDWVIERFGIETKGSKEKKQMKEEIATIKEETEQMKSTQQRTIETQEKIITMLDKLDRRELANELERKRWEVLDFANCIRKRDYDREAYNHVLKTYDQYEKLLEENGMENGEADLAIAYIRKRYQDYIENGFPEY